MPKQVGPSEKAIRRRNWKIDCVLHVFAVYALPIVIGLVSLLALIAWQPQHLYTEPQPLQVKFIGDARSALTPGQALAQLQDFTPQAFHDTQLSEAPVWSSFPVPKDLVSSPMTIEFPSRHALDIACWNAGTLTPLGHGNRRGTSGAISAIKAGFALELNPSLKDAQVLCRTRAFGPARLSALVWRTDALQTSAQEFHRKAGLLDGGLIVLAIFVLLTAVINRNALYVMFAGWLVINLRMGSLSAGWDTQWLGHTVPYDWLLQGRLITLTLYYVLTLTLFTTLFREDLSHDGCKFLVGFLQWTCPPLLLLSAVMPSARFLPFIWFFASVGVPTLVYLLIKILRETRSRVAMWYGAAIGITLVSSLYEVLAAAAGIKELIGSVNSVTAALSSSLLAALAIAEQMRQEHEELLQAKAELAHTFEAMSIGLFTLDMHGRFMSANPALQAMLGPDVLANGGAAWQTYFAEDTRTQLHQLVHSKNRDGMEIRGLPNPDGSRSRRFLVKATLARNKIEGSLQDVTERHLIEMELRLAKLKAEATSHAKSRFLASASHDLRQPAHALGMFVSRLADLPHNEETRKLVTGMEASVHAMQDMLEGFFDISQLDSGTTPIQPVAFPIERILGPLRSSFTSAANEKGLRLRIRPSRAWVCSDPQLLHRIMLNLVSNALRYTDQGSVMVACRPVSDGTQFRLEVRDSGIGIAAEHHEEIFQEFFQVNNPERSRAKGLGVGLSLVQRACRLLKHPLTMRSAPGRGTCFTLTLPRASAPSAAAPANTAEPTSSGDMQGLHVLVIEDDVLGREGLAAMLTAWGCRLTLAQNAQMACDLLEPDQIPNIIISDFRLSDGMDGIQTVRRVRETAGRQIAACLITGDTDAEVKQQAQAAGLPLLYKPVRPAKLRNLLRHAVLPAGERRGTPR